MKFFEYFLIVAFSIFIILFLYLLSTSAEMLGV